VQTHAALQQGPLSLVGNARQEVEHGSDECCRITNGPIVIDLLKNDLLSPDLTKPATEVSYRP